MGYFMMMISFTSLSEKLEPDHGFYGLFAKVVWCLYNTTVLDSKSYQDRITISL